jgi:N-acetyl-anhydromuramyl-L-alanine amidase AmpD
MAILNPNLIQYLVVHCSATSPDKNIGAKEINAMHIARGWSEIGYHIVIRRDYSPLGGYIEYGTRDFWERGAHVKDYNDVSLGICMVGGVDINNKPENNFTENQFKALKKTLDFLTAIFPRAKVCGHRDFPGVNKACPCFNAGKWWLDNTQLPLPLEKPEPVLADIFEW